MAQINAIFQNKFVSPGDQINCMIYLNAVQTFPQGRLSCKVQAKEKTGLRIRESRRVSREAKFN